MQFSVILLLPRVNNQSDVAAAVGGKLPECSDDVILDGEPGNVTDPLFPPLSWKTHLQSIVLDRFPLSRCDSYSLVHGEVFLPHHELQVVNDDVVDVIKVDGVLHCLQHCPLGKFGEERNQNDS